MAFPVRAAGIYAPGRPHYTIPTFGIERPSSAHHKTHLRVYVLDPVGTRSVDLVSLIDPTGGGEDRVLHVIEGGMSTAVLLWEADIERRLAEFIDDHLRHRPCPGPSQVAQDLRHWETGLLRDALSRQESAVPPAARRAAP